MEKRGKSRVLKNDYSAGTADAQTFFTCWSVDSSRLLMELIGGVSKDYGLIYFNTRALLALLDPEGWQSGLMHRS